MYIYIHIQYVGHKCKHFLTFDFPTLQSTASIEPLRPWADLQSPSMSGRPEAVSRALFVYIHMLQGSFPLENVLKTIELRQGTTKTINHSKGFLTILGGITFGTPSR